MQIRMQKGKAGLLALLLIAILTFSLMLPACGSKTDSLKDGTYLVTVALEGGSGKASIASPATLRVQEGAMAIELVWSSKNYDYMVVEGNTYYNENEGGNSTFTIPVSTLSEPLTVLADTTAMSVPHEIEYQLTFTLEE